MKTPKQMRMEEALGIVWSFRERQENTVEKIRDTLFKGVCESVFQNLLDARLIAVEGDRVELTPEGEPVARDIVRRHRLAERLFQDVVEIQRSEAEEVACEFEHIISADVTDAICTLLGHPRVCPHGFTIPPGKCCAAAGESLEPIVVSMDHLAPGEQGKVAYIVTSEHPHLHKLLSLGIVPGTGIVLHQKSPSYVIKVGETQIALDRDVARHIFVRRM